MSTAGPTDEELLAYLDEQLGAERSAEIEAELRSDESLRGRFTAMIRSRDQGVHSVGEIWRRDRLTCPDRNQLGSYLLQALDPAEQSYIRFHLEVVCCRPCRANLEDLQAAADAQPQESQQRRQRYFESSAGYLRRDD